MYTRAQYAVRQQNERYSLLYNYLEKIIFCKKRREKRPRRPFFSGSVMHMQISHRTVPDLKPIVSLELFHINESNAYYT